MPGPDAIGYPVFDQRKLAVKRLVLLLSFCILSIRAPLFGGTFTNPIISDGADPWANYKDGYYYLTATTGWDIKVRRATRLAGTNGIGAALPVSVFIPPATNNQEIWAPELHFIQGKAYIYYAADNGTNANHRMFVAEQVGQTMSFVYKGKVFDASHDRWAIDGTVLQATNGSLYFIWSGWPGATDGLQNLYIAPMSNPWTISGPRVRLSTPELDWESWIQEGPTVLQRNGKVFVIYAANLSWTDNECLGMLVNSDGNYSEPGLLDQAAAAGLPDHLERYRCGVRSGPLQFHPIAGRDGGLDILSRREIPRLGLEPEHPDAALHLGCEWLSELRTTRAARRRPCQPFRRRFHACPASTCRTANEQPGAGDRPSPAAAVNQPMDGAGFQ